LPPNAASSATLLEKPLDPLRGPSINDQHRIIGDKVLDDLFPHNVAQIIPIPSATTKDHLLTPWASVTRSLRAHPASLTPFIPQQASRNRLADAATRPCVNKGCVRALMWRSNAAHNSSVVPIEALCIHDLQIHGRLLIQRFTKSATLMLGTYPPKLNLVDRVWLYLREPFLSHRLHADQEAVTDTACIVWNRLTTERLRSLYNYF